MISSVVSACQEAAFESKPSRDFTIKWTDPRDHRRGLVEDGAQKSRSPQSPRSVDLQTCPAFFHFTICSTICLCIGPDDVPVPPLGLHYAPLSDPLKRGRSIAIMSADVAHPGRMGTRQAPRGARTVSDQRCCSSFPPDGEGAK